MREPAASVRVRSAFVELVAMRVKEFLREPEAVFWTFFFPILISICLGVAFRESPEDRIAVAVVEGAPGDRLLAALRASPALKPRALAEAEGRNALRSGRISLLVVPGETGAVTYVLDPTRPESRAARREVDDALQRAAGRVDPLAPRVAEMKEPGARYIDFLVPGLLGMNVMMAMWGLGFSIVSARLRNLLKRLMATPMRRTDYLLAQIVARLLFLPLEVVLVLGFARLAFGVTVRGSWPALFAVLLVGVAAFSGLGLLVASRTRTIEGLSGLMNLVMLPMWIVSGVFFSYERFPDAALPVIRALPLTAINDALRAIVNEGAGWSAVAPALAVLSAWTLASFGVALKIFRWR